MRSQPGPPLVSLGPTINSGNVGVDIMIYILRSARCLVVDLSACVFRWRGRRSKKT
ncbi:hypothetical protein BC628DRAFT_1344529 [Trametes gibbosa]|nr:hypothetical protein BC628DRAFT_1344529 [Trametes gibbosa]